ncbi:MAG: BMC domain-containing protein [Oscillospiraceae bacterium]|jgi:ethanolamine utilization protein EutM|nr:BMC domain-containing protein [Oscillospiraceae bacterium]MDD3260788.1 BMC domain-containing protein [Oscillospiraceae bacterium]
MAALGIVETRGMSAAVEATDAMCKDARVSVRQVVVPGGGHMAILVQGDVAAVTSAVSAGLAAAQKVGGDIICTNVIPNPHIELQQYLDAEFPGNTEEDGEV